MEAVWQSVGMLFSLEALLQAVTNPVNWGIIGTLVLLEGLLSADNALVLAMMVKHLPEEQRKKALFYGILGSYAFRFVAIALGTVLIKIWWVKLIGAIYLLYLAGAFFWKKRKQGEEASADGCAGFGFWRTVVAVEVMDIAFSVDSVLAAFGVSDQVWVLYLGGILGVLMMRGVAQFFITLIDRYPELEGTAYVLIGVIGAKMMASSAGYEMEHGVFFALMAVVFGSAFGMHYLRPTQTVPVPIKKEDLK